MCIFASACKTYLFTYIFIQETFRNRHLGEIPKQSWNGKKRVKEWLHKLNKQSVLKFAYDARGVSEGAQGAQHCTKGRNFQCNEIYEYEKERFTSVNKGFLCNQDKHCANIAQISLKHRANIAQELYRHQRLIRNRY